MKILDWKKNFAFSLIVQSFGPSNKSGLGKSWQIVDFMFTFEDFSFLDEHSLYIYKKGVSIKRTLLPCINGFHFAETPLWLQRKILVLISFLSLNFSSIEIEGERVSSSQNERTLWGGGVRKWTRMKKRERGGQILGILSERTFWISPKHCRQPKYHQQMMK